MTRLLVSVMDRIEARLALAQGADLIDAKDPSAGALGALPLATVTAIRADLPVDTITSAVAGEDDDVEHLAQSALALAATGVTYVKLGLRQSTARPRAVEELGHRLAGHGRFIAVLFADEDPLLSLTAALRQAGFAGAMLDTRRKTGVRLPDLLPGEELAAFVADCRRQGLLCGLAGSLRIDDIAALARLDPDYLGFRGGLCRAGDRRGELDPQAIALAAAELAAISQGERAA